MHEGAPSSGPAGTACWALLDAARGSGPGQGGLPGPGAAAPGRALPAPQRSPLLRSRSGLRPSRPRVPLQQSLFPRALGEALPFSFWRPQPQVSGP